MTPPWPHLPPVSLPPWPPLQGEGGGGCFKQKGQHTVLRFEAQNEARCCICLRGQNHADGNAMFSNYHDNNDNGHDDHADDHADLSAIIMMILVLFCTK